MGLIRRLCVAATVATGLLGAPPAAAQQPNSFRLIVIDGQQRVTGTCGDTETEVITVPLFGVQIVPGTQPVYAPITVTVPVSFTFDLSDGSTPGPIPSAVTTEYPFNYIFPINTREATGSITMTAEVPDGWTITGPSTVTAEILVQRDDTPCPTTTAPTSPTDLDPAPAPPPAQPVSAAPRLTG